MNKKEAGKNRLWLHVGPAKTGTKTIQTTFAAHRSLLCRHGVLYPMPPSDGRYGKATFHHHSIARALQECHVEYVRGFVATLDEAPDTVLSSEGFQKVSAHMFETLYKTLSERFDVTAIYYAQDPIDRVSSMAQQSIKSGTRSYAEVSAVRKRIPMRSQIEALIAGFGRERVDVRGFGRGFFTNGDLLSDFCQAINRTEVDALLDKGGPANESMTLETALNIDRHRARTGDSRVIRADDPRFREGNTRFRLPEKTLRSIRDVARPDCDWLATEFGIEFAM